MEHKRYSSSTIATYINAISTFLRFIMPKKTEEINNLQSRTYGEGAESVRRIENLNKGKAEMLKKYKTN